MREGARGHLRRDATTATARPGSSRSGVHESRSWSQLGPAHLAEHRLEAHDGWESVRGLTQDLPTWRIRRMTNRAVADELLVI